MVTTRDELIDLASKVGDQAEEAEPGLLIELREEIEYKRDNVASIARMLKGNIHEELRDRAQGAHEKSVEAARVGQQKVDALRARLNFHSFDSEAGSCVRMPPAGGREATPAGRPPAVKADQQGRGPLFRPGQVRGGPAGEGQGGPADLTSLLQGWGQLRANDNGWPVCNGKYVNYPRFRREWVAYRETYHSVMNDDLAAKTLWEKCVKGDALKMVRWRQKVVQMHLRSTAASMRYNSAHKVQLHPV
jgi:hypothetical protein